MNDILNNDIVTSYSVQLMLHITKFDISNIHPFSFILNFAEVVNSSALEFMSPESYYQKLVSSSKFGYTYWSPKCGGELFCFDSFIVADVE